jgi:hypothetical protein
MKERNARGQFRATESYNYKKKMKNHFGDFETKSEEAFKEAAIEKYDFTTCQRPDGSKYGSNGRCIKGSETSPASKDDKKGSSKSGGGGSSSGEYRTRPKGAIESDMKKLTSSGAMNQKGTAGVKAREEHAKLKTELNKPLKGANSKTGGNVSNTKQLRKDMISAKDAEAKARKARKDAEGGDDKAKAKETRAAHIQSKKDMKAATEKFQKAQESGNDPRRFGRSDERSKASNQQLQDALASGKLSPTKVQAVETELRMRKARGK